MTVQCSKCPATTEARGEHKVPVDPNWKLDVGGEAVCPQCQMEQGDTEVPLNGSLASRLVAQLIKRGVRQKLNDVLSELKREFGGTLNKDELYEVGMHSLDLMLVATDEFVDDMKRKLERNRLSSSSVSARGRKKDK